MTKANYCVEIELTNHAKHLNFYYTITPDRKKVLLGVQS